ncbi:MAG: hypothetical protein EU530_05440 [Promethearchaeota archaeon]|nr:MAG: hypothetical protein EU530_05440 [Candidatus Lokiarchaeota archaeon]
MNDVDPSKNTISQLDDLGFQILDLFDQIETQDAKKFEESYCYNVGTYGKLLRALLDQYHAESRNIEDKKRIKPQILFYRELQQYLVFFVRFTSAMYQKDHPYLKEVRDLIEKKDYFIRTKFKQKAIQESMLFESDFREKLEKTLSRRKLSNGN